MESLSEISTQQWVKDLEAPLSRYALSLGLSSHDAQDVVQEGLIALAGALDKNRGAILNPKAYAFTIVRNNANKHFRNRARRSEVEILEDHPEPEEELDKFEEPLLKETFRQAYAGLSDSDRDLIRKYYLEGWTYEQLGDELGCTAQNAWKTVKKIVSQILAGEVKRALSLADPDFAKELFKD